MHIRHFKDLLDQLSDTHTVTLTVSVWEHHGPPFRYEVAYREVRNQLNNQGFHDWGAHDRFAFTDTAGQAHAHEHRRIRIVAIQEIHIQGETLDVRARNFKCALRQLARTNDIILNIAVQKINNRPGRARVPDTFIRLSSRLQDVERMFDSDLYPIEHSRKPFRCVRLKDGKPFSVPRHLIRGIHLKSIDIRQRTGARRMPAAGKRHED